MSPPITRPLETESGEMPSYPRTIAATDRSSVSSWMDNSVNKSLPWVALACILGALAFGGLIILSILLPSMIDANVRSSKAEIRAEFAQQIATVNATAATANQHARVALDKVEQTQVQLGAKGLVQPSTH